MSQHHARETGLFTRKTHRVFPVSTTREKRFENAAIITFRFGVVLLVSMDGRSEGWNKVFSPGALMVSRLIQVS